MANNQTTGEKAMANHYTLKHSQARHIAELLWGTGGTHSYKVPIKGAFYFSCSGHGGYIAGQEAFAPEHITLLEKADYKPDILWLSVQQTKDGPKVIGFCYNQFTCYGKNHFKYNAADGPATWEAYPIYIFEEDCNWAIFEHLRPECRRDATTPADVIQSLVRWNKDFLRACGFIEVQETQ